MPEDLEEIMDAGVNRRHFLKLMSLAGGGLLAAHLIGAEQLAARTIITPPAALAPANIEQAVRVAFNINGTNRSLTLDSRMTLLDALRERLDLTGSKKGCDHGQCGACTVIVDGRRVLSCLTLAASCEGNEITSIEGLAEGNALHPMQAAFLKHDGFQCGYCTPGQICSAVALLNEAKNGDASYVTQAINSKPATPLKGKPLPVRLSADEIRERMSGNICRCGAYPNIVAAIQEVHTGTDIKQTWQFAG